MKILVVPLWEGKWKTAKRAIMNYKVKLEEISGLLVDALYTNKIYSLIKIDYGEVWLI